MWRGSGGLRVLGNKERFEDLKELGQEIEFKYFNKNGLLYL
jgi:hypothetical protein